MPGLVKRLVRTIRRRWGDERVKRPLSVAARERRLEFLKGNLRKETNGIADAQKAIHKMGVSLKGYRFMREKLLADFSDSTERRARIKAIESTIAQLNAHIAVQSRIIQNAKKLQVSSVAELKQLGFKVARKKAA